MNRRKLLKQFGLASGALITGGANAVASIESTGKKAQKPILTVAHITDVHIREGDNAPSRFKACLEQVKKHRPDFILNGGDSINDASYDHVKREEVTAQWALWDDCIQTMKGLKIYSCIGNHDPWWAAPATTDPMYGKTYVVQRLGIPGRYYSFTKENWHFIILDGNNKGISLDEEQMTWLEKELASIPKEHFVLLMSHYPILGTTPLLVGGGHADFKQLKTLFYTHREKVRVCLSGHNHLYDQTMYNGVTYCCNGAMSGFWWGKGDKESAGTGYYLETPPGYAILHLYSDGTLENNYYPHGI